MIAFQGKQFEAHELTKETKANVILFNQINYNNGFLFG